MLSQMQKFVYRAQGWLERHESDIILAMGVALISLLSFAVGFLTAEEQLKEPIQIEIIEPNGQER